MRFATRRYVMTVALLVLGALSVGYGGCVPNYAIAIVAPPLATSADQYDVIVINEHGDILQLPYAEFKKAKSVIPLFERARGAP